METVLYITCLRFSIQLILSEAVFLVDRSWREHFALRLAGTLAAYFALASGWYALLHQIPGAHAPVFVAFYLGLFLLSMGGIWFCFDLIPMELLFVSTGGYAVEHITFALGRVLQHTMGWTEETKGIVLHTLVFRLLIYILGAGAAYFFLIRKNRDKGDFKPKDGRIVMLALAMLMAAIVLSVFYCTDDFMEQGTLASGILCPLYSALCCMLVLLMEYYVLRENRMKREQETMEQLLHLANSQRKSSREAIDIINMKCHDLKHQIRALANLSDAVQRTEYMAEVEQAVSIYNADYHTGCEALDYVLREKALISDEHHVTFSCMADGGAIAFMRPADIYALMGNALTNALERVVQEPEDQRIISLQIKRAKEMVLIHLENRCSNPPEFRDGLPVTDKEDKTAHGFGVKSIRYVVEKYHGELLMQAKGGRFSVDILLTLQTSNM